MVPSRGAVDGEAFEEFLCALDVGFGGEKLGFGCFGIGLGDGDIVGAILYIVHADGALVFDGVQAVEHVLHFRVIGLLEFHGCLGDGDAGALADELGAEFTVVDLEQRVALFDLS